MTVLVDDLEEEFPVAVARHMRMRLKLMVMFLLKISTKV